jgi:phage terminase large subunit-like protein
MAKAFLRVLKREMESNELLKRLFPDVLWADPQKEAPKWSEDDGLVVKRRGNPKESTIEAWGLVDGMPTGKHFGILDMDDIVTKDNVGSPEMREKVLEAWRLALNLGKRGGRRRMRGTRYHFGDPYGAIIEAGSAIPRIYPALPIVGHTATGQAILGDEPVLLTKAELETKRRDMGQWVFSSQMLMSPVQDSNVGFRAEWLRTYTGDAEGNTYVLIDPANAKKKKSDYTAVVVITCAADQNYYVRWLCRDRLNLVERINLVMWLHKEFKPMAIGYEQYGLMADVEAIRIEQDRAKYRFDITELGGTLAKFDRIQALAPLFEQRRVYLPATCFVASKDRGQMIDMVDEFVRHEYTAHPYSIHDDMLDAFARILDPMLGVKWPRATESNSRYMRVPQRRVNREMTRWVA